MVKKWKFRGGGGVYVKFPPWWGYGYFLELHNKNEIVNSERRMFTELKKNKRNWQCS